MDVLVSGSEGLIGKQLTHELRSRGHMVFEFDTLHGSSVSDIKGFRKLLRYSDALVHLGSPSSSILFDQDPERCWRTTVATLRTILRHYRGRVIIPSSGTVYGSTKNRAREGGLLPSPVSLYASAKLECERLGLQALASGRDVRICRIFTGYGIHENRKQSYASPPYTFVREALLNRPISIYGDGAQQRDFIYVDDIARGIAKTTEVPLVNSAIFNIGTGVSVSFNDLLDKIRAVTGCELTVNYGPSPPSYVYRATADVEKARKELGWCAAVSLDEGITRIVNHLRSTLLGAR